MTLSRLTVLLLWITLILFPSPNCAEAESIYRLEDHNWFRQQGLSYFDAVQRLNEVQRDGRQRIQNALEGLQGAGTRNEFRYWQLDYMEQRVWVVVSKVGVCIDLLRNQEKLFQEVDTAARARSQLAQSEFMRGLIVLHRMQRRLAPDKGSHALEEDLLEITLLSMAGVGYPDRTIPEQWRHKRNEIIEQLKSMRHELANLSRNLDMIDVQGGAHAESR